MTLLMKHEFVAERDEDNTGDEAVLFWADLDNPIEQIGISYENWLDFGRPDTLTITVQPGDLLNVAPNAATSASGS